jgi:thiamine biosynthesis protein ThiI
MAPPPSPGTTFLVRFGEIGIKSLPVRRRFERLLAENILRSVHARGAEGTVEQTWGRLVLRAPEAVGRDVLARTFGVVSFSPSLQAPRELPALAAFAGEASSVIPPRASFAVRARRSGEQGFTSQDVARAVGAAILERHRARGLTVDLEAPQAEVVVEVRSDHAWVAFETLPGPGGLPVGSEGRVSAWVARPRDALAAWWAMKRGCRADLLAPEGRGEALAKLLAPWDAALELTEVPWPADLDEASPSGRALVLALLRAHAWRRKASAVVVGDRFDEAMALAPLDRRLDLPVFRPLLALEPETVAAAARALGIDAPPQPSAAPAQAGTDAPSAEEAKALAANLLRGMRRRKVSL